VKKLQSMSFEELVDTRAQIRAAIELHMAREREALISMLKMDPSSAEKNPPDTESHPLKGRKLAPKYRNPEDRSQVWAGRGNTPRWLTAALKSGKKLESFAVK
jgi:DNA-binding protein H-NS